MKLARIFASIVGLACLAHLVPARSAPTTSSHVLKIVLDDTINPITEEFIGRAIETATKEKDQAVLIELATPGGLFDSMRGIVSKILESPVPVIVYVTPTGSRAASAGFFILESADVAAMAPGTNTGAAHPVILGEKMDPVMKEKLENDAAAFMRSYAGKRGRDVEIAESAVRQSKSFTDQEALSQNLVDYVAKDENDLFAQLQGKSIKRFDGSSLTLQLANPQVATFDMSVKQRILDTLMDPNISFLLLAAGALFIYLEFHTPGAIIPGVIGFIAVLLAIFALHLLPTSYAAIAMILGAFVLFALEAKFASHGALTLGGTALLILGALMLVDGPIPQMRVRLITAVAVGIPFAFITAFLMNIALRARRNKVAIGQEALIGQTAVVRSPLTPEGKVVVMGELWNAVSSAPADVGSRVRIRSVDGLKLEVEPDASVSTPTK